jgi:hypothetical protein
VKRVRLRQEIPTMPATSDVPVRPPLRHAALKRGWQRSANYQWVMPRSAAELPRLVAMELPLGASVKDDLGLHPYRGRFARAERKRLRNQHAYA